MNYVPRPSPHERLERYLSRELSGAARGPALEGAVLGVLGLACLLAVAVPGLGRWLPPGIVLAGAGAVTFACALAAQRGPDRPLSILLALIAIAAGLHLLWSAPEQPRDLALLLAACFAARGIVTILLADAHRRRGLRHWEWLTVSGVASLTLAMIVLSGLPGPYLWMFGVLLGVALVFDGSARLALSLQGRSRAAEAVFDRTLPVAEARHRLPPRPLAAAAPSRWRAVGWKTSFAFRQQARRAFRERKPGEAPSPT